jgi:hypothetical protein
MEELLGLYFNIGEDGVPLSLRPKYTRGTGLFHFREKAYVQLFAIAQARNLRATPQLDNICKRLYDILETSPVELGDVGDDFSKDKSDDQKVEGFFNTVQRMDLMIHLAGDAVEKVKHLINAITLKRLEWSESIVLENVSVYHMLMAASRLPTLTLVKNEAADKINALNISYALDRINGLLYEGRDPIPFLSEKDRASITREHLSQLNRPVQEGDLNSPDDLYIRTHIIFNITNWGKHRVEKKPRWERTLLSDIMLTMEHTLNKPRLNEEWEAALAELICAYKFIGGARKVQGMEDALRVCAMSCRLDMKHYTTHEEIEQAGHIRLSYQLMLHAPWRASNNSGRSR